MRIFVSVVEAGSFTVAAQRLQIPVARVSRAVAGLESYIRARLLDRSRRRVALTNAGGRYLKYCERILAYVSEAQAEVGDLYSRHVGTLRIHAMTSIGTHYVVPAVRQYQLAYPDVSIQLILAQHVPDMLGEGYNLSVVVHDPSLEVDCAVQRIGSACTVVCAAPNYLEKHGIPTRPSELLNHVCLRTLTMLSPADVWSFNGPHGDESIALRPASFQVNDEDAMMIAVRAGMGIALLPDYVASVWIKRGEIVRIMPDYASQTKPIYARYPVHQHSDIKIKALCNILRLQCGGHVLHS